jgi:hypothetical protein
MPGRLALPVATVCVIALATSGPAPIHAQASGATALTGRITPSKKGP